MSRGTAIVFAQQPTVSSKSTSVRASKNRVGLRLELNRMSFEPSAAKLAILTKASSLEYEMSVAMFAALSDGPGFLISSAYPVKGCECVSFRTLKISR